jgi:hypothetical protein
MRKYVIAGILIATFAACHVTKKTTKPALDCTTVPSTYKTDILPIINQNCSNSCHGYGSKHGDFTTYDGLNAVVKSGEFELRVLINQSMPPKGPLPEEDRKKIRCWLNNGALDN